MDDDTPRRSHEAIVERKSYRVRRNARRGAGSERLARRLLHRLAVTQTDFLKINAPVLSRLCEIKKEILQREIVQHHDARIFNHRFEDAGVITMIVSHVIDNRIVRIKLFQDVRPFAIIKNLETRNYFGVGRLEAIDKQSNLRSLGQIRQQLFAVVRDA